MMLKSLLVVGVSFPGKQILITGFFLNNVILSQYLLPETQDSILSLILKLFGNML